MKRGSGSMSQGRAISRARRRVKKHRFSVIVITCVLALLTTMFAVKGVSLQAKKRDYQAQAQELELQLQDAQAKKEEINELEKYVGTDEYIAEIAKEKLGLVYEGEILFEAEP